MDYTSIGSSVNSYIKSLDMQMKWQNKKCGGSFEKEASDESNAQTSIAEENADDKKEDERLKRINSKLLKGDRLTPLEKQYLLGKDPQAYSKVMDIELEQMYYERQLKLCRTKDEFRRASMFRTASALEKVKSVTNSSGMTEDEKLEVISGERMRAAAAERTEREFMRSGEFSSLPTVAEYAIAAKKLAKAAAAERQRKKEENARTPVVVKKRKPKLKNKKNGRTVSETKTVESAGSKKRYRIKRGLTKAQAEQSPEVKKVKRSRRKYRNAVAMNAVFAAEVAVKTLNIKA